MNINALLTGYVEIVLSGENPERVINMAMIRGIYLWDIHQEKEGYYSLKVRVGGYKALRYLVRRNSCKAKITKKGGFPFVLMRYKKRKVLASGILFFCIVLYTLSSFVWSIEVIGNERVKKDELISVIEANGLRVGALKNTLDKEKIKYQLLKQQPELAWVNIQIQGTKAIIEVVEKTPVPQNIETKAADIVAANDGKIEELLILSGTPLVKEGDRVKKGQLIISGIEYSQIIVNEDGTLSPGGDCKRVRARGLVRARVIHEEVGRCKIYEDRNVDTGEEISVVMIKSGDYNIILKGPKNVPYEHYRTINQSKRVLLGRNQEGPVELITIIYREQKHESKFWGIEGAYKEAVNRARTKVQAGLPEDHRVIEERHSPITSQEKNTVQVKFTLEVIENIVKYTN